MSNIGGLAVIGGLQLILKIFRNDLNVGQEVLLNVQDMNRGSRIQNSVTGVIN